MTSEQDDTVFPDEDFDDDDDELSEEEEEDEEDDDVLPDPEDDDVINSASPSTSSPTVTVAVPSSSVPHAVAESPIATSAITTTVITTTAKTPSPKRQRIEQPVLEEKKPQPIPIDDSRRLFQRLWTDEDEIELLQGFLDYTTSRGSTHHNDTALFYDQIKSKLQLDFNKNQLVEKLRRLKKKYRNVLSKISTGKDFSFKSPHDQSTFEISAKIWSTNNNSNINQNHHGNTNNRFAVAVDDSVFDDEDPTPKNPNFMEEINSGEKKAKKRSRSRIRGEEKANGNENLGNNSGGNLGGLIEETVKSCLSPLFKELLSNAMGGGVGFGGRGIGFGGLGMNAMALNAMPLSFGGGEGGSVVDEKWRKQQILELEVYSKRLELVQDQIRAALEELRSI
ncbi:probable transcription factor At3g04930 [Fagus crenata]